MSRLQAGALAVLPRPADLGEIVADVLDLLGPQSRTVLADIPSGLPEVMADPAITERIIANLVGNALRYSPAASPPLLTARALRDRVELHVIDHGLGIPEADRQRVFLPFHQLGSPGSPPGIGLGLTVSRSLAEVMGGATRPAAGMARTSSDLPGRPLAHGVTRSRPGHRPGCSLVRPLLPTVTVDISTDRVAGIPAAEARRDRSST